MLNTEFGFGEKIIVSGYIIRSRDGIRREWLRFGRDETEAIFLGAYNLSNGNCKYINHGEDGVEYYFDHQEYIQGAWICIKGRKPEKVLLSDCRKIK